MRDVIVVGGGPAGLHAAWLLALRGFDGALYEEHHSPGEPVHCTGVLAAEAFQPNDPPLNRPDSELLAKPSRPVREMRGNSAARAAPISALAALAQPNRNRTRKNRTARISSLSGRKRDGPARLRRPVPDWLW